MTGDGPESGEPEAEGLEAGGPEAGGPLFGRQEAAALLAVERANGGEFAAIEQVLSCFNQMFRVYAGAESLEESFSLLIDASLVEWDGAGLALLPDGRKLIRRSGAHWDPELPALLADRLSAIDEDTLSPEGELPAPTAEQIGAAYLALGRDAETGRAPVAGGSLVRELPALNRLRGLGGGPGVGFGLGAGLTVSFGDDRPPTVPLVRPAGTRPAEEDRGGQEDEDRAPHPDAE
ncbi:MAG: hypothetical protein ACRDZP_07600 [Acidimicrobiales bacterium]